MSFTTSILFLFLTTLGTLITLSSSSWLMIWIGMELNALALFPLMAHADTPLAKKTALKYFTIQTTTAIVMLIGVLMLPQTINQSSPDCLTHNIALMMIMFGLTTKLALVPAHTWLLEIIRGQSRLMIMILTTWQKLAPLWVFIKLAPSFPTLTWILAEKLTMWHKN
uniref:NADH-ubiquinone oxidoreductase chain 2 n=1 Tax=Callopanchax occidentalis TaxID=52668 RepID=Q9TD60_9TELE|nr:NADH dehydrogenase subunit II [Callopanchax occidentalis]